MSVQNRRLWAGIGCVAAAAAVGFGLAEARSPSPDATAAKIGFAKGPYLQGLGATSVTVKVEIPTAAPARLEVHAPGETAITRAVSSAGDATFHALRVDGLRPAQSYEYVVSAGGAISERGRFTTAPDDTRPFRFLAYGDNRSDEAAHAAVVRAMSRVPADFLINTGDMVARGTDPADWRTFFTVEGALLRDRCLFAAVGNHELYRGDRAGEVAFLRYFGGIEQGRELTRLYGTFRWSNTRFFVLNAMDTWTGDEREWLRAELDRALVEPGLAHRIAVMHHGPFSAGPHGGNAALAKGDVIALMRDRKVDLVLAGHDHVYERGEGEGLKYLVTGGGGAPLYQKKYELKETRAFEPAHHFVEITVDGDKLRAVAHRASGGVLEACGFTGASGWDCDAAPAAVEPARGEQGDKGDKPTPPRSTPASSPRAGLGCGCALPGDAPVTSGPIALIAAALLTLSRRRRR